MHKIFKHIFLKVWQWHINRNGDSTFMNTGYSCSNQNLKLKKSEEKDRYAIQLYQHITTAIDIIGKDVLEVGCGNGGGLAYINRYLLPNSVTGVDINSKAIKFCKTKYINQNIPFFKANAQKLPFLNRSFNVVLNIESSHNYKKPELFFDEVYRVLKTGGYFLFADYRNSFEIEKLNKQLKQSKFHLVNKQDITPNIVEALKVETQKKVSFIEQTVPMFFQNIAKELAVTEGTLAYRKFSNRKFIYFYYVLRKQ